MVFIRFSNVNLKNFKIYSDKKYLLNHNRYKLNRLLGLWDKYSAVFPNIWAATAFKGATGSTQHVPIIRHHISNHEKWLEELGVHVSKIREFRGTAFTGWSR